MSVIDRLVDEYGYLAVGIGVGLESVGLPLPGETALIAAATYAGATHHLSTVAVVAVAAAAAILGDNLGFWLGRVFGARLLGRLARRLGPRGAQLHRLETLLDQHGGSVVMSGRFVSIARTYTAFLAGSRRMSIRRFVTFNAIGAAAWASLIGFGAAALGSKVGTWGSYTLTAAVTALATLIAVGRRHRHRAVRPRTTNEARHVSPGRPGAPPPDPRRHQLTKSPQRRTDAPEHPPNRSVEADPTGTRAIPSAGSGMA